MSLFDTTKKRVLTGVAALAIVALGGSLAYAYWSSTGTGVGSATTGTSTNFVVTSTAPTGGPLTPGGPSQTVAFTVKNPGTGAEHLTNVAITVANADGTTWAPTGGGCSKLDYTVGTPTITYGDIAPAATVSGTVTVTMNNLTTNQDGCKTLTVPLYILAS